MRLKKNKGDEASRQFWAYVERTAEEVKSWPAWKRGESMDYKITLIISAEPSGFVVENDWLKIFSNGDTLAKALYDFGEQVAHLQERYRVTDEKDLIGEGRALKRRFAAIPTRGQ